MPKVVAVDLGGSKVLARLVDTETGEASQWRKKKTPKSGVGDVLDAVESVVNKIDPGHGAPAVGIGVPGLVLPDGTVTRCPNIVGWDSPISVKAEFERRFGRPVAVGNDVNCGALAEFRFGAGLGSDSILAVFVGTGVGGGIVLDGKVVTGPRGMGGEIGHSTVVPGGRMCGCGGVGHLEAYAGKAGMAAEAIRLAESGRLSVLVELMNGGRIKSSHLSKALDAGCEVTRDLVRDGADALANAIGSLATVLDIDLAVFGGGVVDRLGDDFLDQISVSDDFGGFGADTISLVRAQRISDAGVLGAAILAGQLLESGPEMPKYALGRHDYVSEPEDRDDNTKA